MKSIRRDMTIWLIATVGVLLVISNVSLYQYVHHVLLAQFDEALLDEAVSISSMTLQEPEGHLEFELNPASTPQFLETDHPQYFQVWTMSDESFARSPSLQGGDLKPVSKSPHPHIANIRLPDGRLGRRVDYRFRPSLELVHGRMIENPPPPAPEMVTVIARERESLDKTLANIKGFSVVASLVIAASGALAISFIVKRTTRTLSGLGQEVEAIKPDNLQGRLSVDNLPSELQPIVRQLNNLLDRLQSAMQREHRFTADAAHELRTPIAELRTLTDVVGQWPIENEAIGQAIRDVKEISIRMETLVDALLSLSRHDAGSLLAKLETVDLCRLFSEVQSKLEPRAAAKGVRFDRHLPSSATVCTDPVLVRACLANLLDNAITHSPEGSQIHCKIVVADDDGAAVMLSIMNPSQVLSEADMAHISEPFWRKDASRTESKHFGLGLALVNAYAVAMSIALSLKLDSNAQFVVQLQFPAMSAMSANSTERNIF